MKNETVRRLLSITVLLTLFSAPQSFASEILEAYGDSITAGFMTRTDVTHAPPLKNMGDIVSDLAMFLMTRDKSYVAKHHAPELAWPALLANALDPADPLSVENQAVSGAHAWEMLSQVRAIPKRKDTVRAFFFIGHNDLCNNMDDPDVIGDVFSQEVEEALKEWDKRHAGSRAYLIPVGEIHKVYQALSGYVWHRGPQKNYACEDSWTKLFPYCPSHFAKHKAGTFESYMRPRLDAMNSALDKLATSWNKKSTSNRFAYLKDAHDLVYDKDFFAVDCFHLSARGQQAISDRLSDLVAAVP